uniref:Ribbon-helix-helix protein CopG domain-containing protein n=1 Tax=uncultured Thiotrichaceae bacterium TaxID=298394 RepID=A0A6S6UJ99_9GAMM|nr:MAG: Unknown protein [uncultured Thiotrichaceae bacterium]
METQKLTVRLPQDDLKFIKQFAVEHNLTVTELIRRHFFRLRQQEGGSISPKLQTITGILPENINTPSESQDYYDYMLDKHQ